MPWNARQITVGRPPLGAVLGLVFLCVEISCVVLWMGLIVVAEFRHANWGDAAFLGDVLKILLYLALETAPPALFYATGLSVVGEAALRRGGAAGRVYLFGAILVTVYWCSAGAIDTAFWRELGGDPVLWTGVLISYLAGFAGVAVVVTLLRPGRE